MKVLGLTGGIGMGKSTAAQFLERLGWLVVDTDLLAREVVAPGQPALAELQRTFGNDILDAAGALRRESLAEVVFADESQRRRLEAIVHPLIRQRWTERVEQARVGGVLRVVVVIPLLFETNSQAAFDCVLCVACRTSTQRRRLLARGWTEEHVAQRVAAQWPVERKMLAADFVVWAEGSLEVHAEQLRRVQGVLAASGV